MNQTQKPPDVRTLIRSYAIQPKKGLGQNFLLNQGSLRKIVSSAGLTGEETVIEIGAGLGSLTYHLSQAAENVIAVEFDSRLIPALESVLIPLQNVQMVVGDILQLDINELAGNRPYIIMGNIPYNITSILIRRLLESENPAYKIILTIQKEVADRIIAPPGKLSLLALSVQVYGKPKITGYIPSESFYPQPKVDSAVLRIDLHQDPVFPRDLISTFFQLAKVAFHQKRKQLRNSVAGGLGLSKDLVADWLKTAQIDPRKRPQELDLEAWQRLAEVVSRHQTGS